MRGPVGATNTYRPGLFYGVQRPRFLTDSPTPGGTSSPLLTYAGYPRSRVNEPAANYFQTAQSHARASESLNPALNHGAMALCGGRCIIPLDRTLHNSVPPLRASTPKTLAARQAGLVFLPELSPASTRYPTNPALIQLTPATDHEPDTRQLAEGTEPIRRFISLRPVGLPITNTSSVKNVPT